MFNFPTESLKTYEEEEKKTFEFPLGKFDFKILQVLPAKKNNFGQIQAEITFRVDLGNRDLESKDWFGYEPKEMWKWASLMKAIGLSGKVKLQDLSPADLQGKEGVLEGKDIPVKRDGIATGEFKRVKNYLPKKNTGDDITVIPSIKDQFATPHNINASNPHLADIPF